jgi:uncharacterized protein (TIGR03435 family)
MVQRLVLRIGISLALAAGSLVAQTAAPPLTFDVASIKPSAPVTPAMVAGGTLHAGMKIDAARVDIGMFSLQQLISKAYDVKPYQITGPPWLNVQRFDIVAKMPPGSTKEQVPQMLQALLAERFKLVLHRETKEEAVYALVVAKGGPKLKESAPKPVAAAPADTGEPTPPASSGSSTVTLKTGSGGAVASDGEHQQKMSMLPDGKTMHIEVTNTTMAELAPGLAPLVGRPIVDMTELKGKYDLALDLSLQDLMAVARAQGANVPSLPGAGADASKPAEAASDPSGGSIFTAIQALGLKLEPRKTNIERLIVDSVEKMPTEN